MDLLVDRSVSQSTSESIKNKAEAVLNPETFRIRYPFEYCLLHISSLFNAHRLNDSTLPPFDDAMLCYRIPYNDRLFRDFRQSSKVLVEEISPTTV